MKTLARGARLRISAITWEIFGAVVATAARTQHLPGGTSPGSTGGGARSGAMRLYYSPRRTRTRASHRGLRQGTGASVRQLGHRPQNVTAASCVSYSSGSCGSMHGAVPTAHTTSRMVPHARHTKWW